MKIIILIILLFLIESGYGQTTTPCKIEVYLLKEKTAKINPTIFSPTLQDLEVSALIADEEITGYRFEKLKVNVPGKGKKTRRVHNISTSISLEDRISNSDLQTAGGRLFALVINKDIIYWGYLTSTFSSIVPDGKVNAKIRGYEFELVYYSSNPKQDDDPRENKILFDCLKKTGRYFKSTKRILH